MNSPKYFEVIAERQAKDKEALLKALSEHAGMVASACRSVNISRTTFYTYYDQDPDFREKVDDVKELQKDFGESLILKKMKEGDTTMIIFYAKTQMKDRGYVERRELVGKDGAPLANAKEVDISKLTEEQRAALLSIGEDILNKKE